MGELTRRYVWVVGSGAAFGLGWWLLYLLVTVDCTPGFFGCDVAAVWLVPVWPPAGWLVVWFVLSLRDIDRPGVTAASGVAVTMVLALITVQRGIPLSPWAVVLGAASFLIGGMLAS